MKKLQAAVWDEAKEINSILQTKEKAISNFYHCLFWKDHNQWEICFDFLSILPVAILLLFLCYD